MHVRPIERKDLADAARVKAAAFSTDELFRWIFPGLDKYPEDFYLAMLSSMREQFVSPACWGFVCVSDSNDDFVTQSEKNGQEQILGFAFWRRNGPDREKSVYLQNNRNPLAVLDHKLLDWEKSYTRFFGLDRCISEANMRGFREGAAKNNVTRPVANRDFWWLMILGVSPQYQRRGVGGALVDWGVARAREEGIPIMLIASDDGRGLYAKNGFKVVGTSTIAHLSAQTMVFDENREYIHDIAQADAGPDSLEQYVDAAWNEVADNL